MRARSFRNSATTGAGGPPSTSFCEPCCGVCPALRAVTAFPKTEPVTPNPSATRYAMMQRNIAAMTRKIGR